MKMKETKVPIHLGKISTFRSTARVHHSAQAGPEVRGNMLISTAQPGSGYL